MNRHNILPRTLIAAAAATAVAASPALAKPADVVPRSVTEARTSSLAGTPSPRQDLRMPDRQSPALPPETRQDLRMPDRQSPAPAPDVQAGQPTWPASPEPLTKPVVATDTSTGSGGDGDSVWVVLGIGLAGAGLIAGSAAGLSRRSKVRARRVAV